MRNVHNVRNVHLRTVFHKHVNRVLEKENGPEAISEDIMAKNFPKLRKDINLMTESSSVNPQNIKYKNK